MQLGIDDRVGSIEEGKDGDIAIFENHPLSIYAVPQMTYVDGVKYFDINEDAADQRIFVDPESTIEDVVIFNREDHDMCMHEENILNFYELLNEEN